MCVRAHWKESCRNCYLYHSARVSPVIIHVRLTGLTDIDECALAAVTGLQACQGDAECKNTPGSFTCLCPAGYVMALNGQTCVGEVDVLISDVYDYSM